MLLPSAMRSCELKEENGRQKKLAALAMGWKASTLRDVAQIRGPGTKGTKPPVLEGTRSWTSSRNWRKPALPARQLEIEVARE